MLQFLSFFIHFHFFSFLAIYLPKNSKYQNIRYLICVSFGYKCLKVVLLVKKQRYKNVLIFRKMLAKMKNSLYIRKKNVKDALHHTFGLCHKGVKAFVQNLKPILSQ